jgi:hypothetical protein
LAAQKKQGLFRDSLDHAFDISKWLLDIHGFIPLVSPITEPAIGYGAAGAAVYFIPKKKSPDKGFQMPDIAGLGGGYTSNGTWLIGAGYNGFWKDNTIRYRGGLGYTSVNLKYYGTEDGLLASHPLKFNMESFFLLQQVQFRISESNFFLGGNYIFNETKITFFEESELPGLDPLDFNIINSGFTLIAEYETLNNILSPTKGVKIQLSSRAYFVALGSNRNSQRLSFSTVGYAPIFEKWNAGFRFDAQMASGQTPFFMLPFINLRGVPAMRYQDELILLLETEQYFNVYRRWGLVAFGGYGRAMENIGSWPGGSGAWNAGAGFRYLIARLLGLRMGIDVARGPENWAFYIVFGSSWLK